MLKSYKKNIFCLESLWDENIEQKLSVLPILELVAKLDDVKLVHLSCNTIAEFEYNIRLISRKKSYKILYLAFHGSIGKIHFADKSELDLNDIADILGNHFRDWVIHFSSCNTLEVDDDALSEFVDETNVGLVTGYTKTVDWAESAAFELLLFHWLQYYKSPRHLWNYLQKTFPDLIEVNGLKFCYK
jgi:hypothetical protein